MSIEDHQFEESYKNTLYKLEETSKTSDFSIDETKRELQALYTYEGQDWIGRGEIKQADISGSINAYQVFLFRWKNNKYSWLPYSEDTAS